MIGLRERIRIIREEKAVKQEPDSFFSRKLAVFIVLGLFFYVYYVFVIRLCLPILRRDIGAQGSFTQGLIYCILYHLSFLLFCWSYARVITTSPGYARDVIPLSDPPIEECTLVVGAPYNEQDAGKEEVPRHSDSTIESRDQPAPLGSQSDLEKAIPTDDVDKLQRTPPQIPLLTDKYRYDAREGLLRPLRSHRCSTCRSVTLAMDHHCPWVGLCVGARNKKFFYNFLQAASLFTLFLFISLVIANTLTRHSSLDRQQVAIMIISGVFSIFTSALLASHTRLLLLNITTIEEIMMNRNIARERAMLSREFGFMGWREKKATKARWNQEWGRWSREMNLWSLGSKRANWVSVMGESKWGWILPTRTSPDDGISYKTNPRFDPQGIMRRRQEWPEELR